jgi:hypothetical protein
MEGPTPERKTGRGETGVGGRRPGNEKQGSSRYSLHLRGR